MVDRKWLPHVYQDESIPPTRATPDAWIAKQEDGSFVIRCAPPWDDMPVIRLQDGDIVEFDWFESYGAAQVEFKADGSWRCTATEPAPSPGGDLLVAAIADWESAMGSLEEFCASRRCFCEGEEETISIQFYAWSINPTRFLFQGGKFVPAPAAN